jgi:pimeloyl-ACP methyl ester carboxylesterase
MVLAHERRGDGEPLVLVHGIGSHRQVWAPVLDALAAQRDTIAVDLPGFGESALEATAESGPLTPADHARAVAGLLDELGLETAHVAGNSLGGGVALELARMGRARSATGLSPVGFWTARENAYGRAVLRTSRRLARALAPLPSALTTGPVAQTLGSWHLASRPWRIPPDVAADAARNLAVSPGFDPTLEGFRTWRFRDGHELACPVTIAWAQHDRLLIPRQAQRARRALPGARHVLLTGCGHVPTWDDPEQVAQLLLEGSRCPA